MKRLGLVLLLFITCVCAHAQIGEARRDFAVGFGGGLAMNKVAFRPGIKQDMYMGPTLGVTGRYTCEKYFSMICALQVEANYSLLGWKEDIETSSDTYQRNLHYIQIPFLAHLGIGREHKGFKGYFIGGPQLGFCIGENEKKGGEWSEQTLSLRPNHTTQQYDRKVENKFDYGITAGAGVEFSTKNNLHILLEGRYYFALGDIFGNSKKDPFARSANGTIFVKASVLFDIVKTR